MTIKVGEKIPDATFFYMSEDGPAKMTTGQLCDGKKVVLFGVPGAFTPTCHANHLPGFLDNLDALKDKGVDEVAVTSVNDIHVINAWSEATKGGGKIHYLSDGNGDFAKAIGMDMDMSMGGMGVRSKRYSMIIDDGVVSVLNIEDMPGKAEQTSAANILAAL